MNTSIPLKPFPPRGGKGAGLLIATGISFLILCGLGTWQLQRLAWKTDLLQRIAALQGAPARPNDLTQPVVGVLRTPEHVSAFAAPDQTAKNLWYRREVAPMAQALQAVRPLPQFLMLESPSPQGGGPVAAPIPLEIPNRHLEYALTWFGLALALVGVYIAKRIRDAADRPKA